LRSGRAADHSHPSSAAVMDYTSTHPLGHTGPVTGSLYFYFYSALLQATEATYRHVFRCIRVVAKSSCYLRLVRPSVRIFQCNFHLTYLCAICYRRLLREYVDIIQIWLKLNKNTGQFTCRPKYLLLLLAT